MYMPSRHFVSRPEHMMGSSPLGIDPLTWALLGGAALLVALPMLRKRKVG